MVELFSGGTTLSRRGHQGPESPWDAYRQSGLFASLTRGELYRYRQYDLGDNDALDAVGDRILFPASSGAVFLSVLYRDAAYHARKAVLPMEMLAEATRLVRRPPGIDDVFWPSDLIDSQGGESSDMPSDAFDAFDLVGQCYSDDSIETASEGHSVVYLFPLRASNLTSLSEYLGVGGRRGKWEDGISWRAAYDVAAAVDALNRSGYEYHDFHLGYAAEGDVASRSRLYMKAGGGIFLDFSDLIFRNDLEADSTLRAPSMGHYPLEFADPAYVRGIRERLHKDAQNYSLCALLFFVLFGRHPYEGRLFSGQADGDVQQHYVKLRRYHETPIFIFDEDDTENCPGKFDEDDQLRDLWDRCPEEIRGMFRRTLAQDNALAAVKPYCPEPSEWMAAFVDAGWHE